MQRRCVRISGELRRLERIARSYNIRRGARRFWHVVLKLLNLLVYCDLVDSHASSYKMLEIARKGF